MNFFHLSHTDMDGYCCQLISKKIFPNGYFLNANYGLEVKMFIKDILCKIEQSSKDEDILLMITDLNLTVDEAKHLNKHITGLNDEGYNIKIQLLDHHGTGQKSADRFDWYYLDTSRSATKITYDYFKENYKNFEEKCEENFDLLVQAVNAADIWLSEDELFEYGKVCMSMVGKSYEINNTIFPKKFREYKHFLLTRAIEFLELKDGHITLDENIYKLKKEFLNTKDKNDTIDNISSTYLVESLENVKEDLTIYYKEHKGLLTYCLGSISIPANAFLKANPDYHFFIDINRRGRAGFRADNKIDVSKLAQKLAKGGGHPNASGAAFSDFKETALYEDVKSYIQNKLDNCL
ncbi:MAG: phosphoesterase [Campylobacterota bacterium]|nr:phosphoesterase [Campylobacterota bacterium]